MVPARWYALQVRWGSERSMAALLNRVLPASVLVEPVFRPQYETEMKVRGTWKRVIRPMLDGYLIAVSDDAPSLASALARVVEFKRLLAMDSGPTPLAPEEVALFGGLAEAGHRVVPMSRAYKAGERLAIISGPLKGREALIDRIDRRRSTAVLKLQIDGTVVGARAGIAVLADTKYTHALAAPKVSAAPIETAVA